MDRNLGALLPGIKYGHKVYPHELLGAGMGIFGSLWYVDGTNGSDDDVGTSPDSAFATIQKAVTAQIAYSTGLGDGILVFPGTYAETVYASELSNVQLLGVGVDSVIIAPTDGHALLVGVDGTTVSTMTNSSISNITFLTPSTSNVTYAALLVGVMTKSVIEDCKFKGTTVTGTDASATIGIQIGNRSDTEWEFHEHSRISRCEFTSNAGRTSQPGIGIEVGSHTKAQPTYSGFKSMIIEDCLISSKDRGIRLNVGAASCGGSIIRRNAINGQEAGGVDMGIRHVSGGDLLCSVHDNRIIAINDGIFGFSTGNVQGNIVALEYGGTPTAETA